MYAKPTFLVKIVTLRRGEEGVQLNVNMMLRVQKPVWRCLLKATLFINTGLDHKTENGTSWFCWDSLFQVIKMLTKIDGE